MRAKGIARDILKTRCKGRLCESTSLVGGFRIFKVAYKYIKFKKYLNRLLQADASRTLKDASGKMAVY
jgi:hypothetical protein